MVAHALVEVLTPVLLAPLVASVAVVVGPGAKALRDPTDWTRTHWQWTGGGGTLLFREGEVRVVEHGQRWRTLRYGTSIQSASLFDSESGELLPTAPAFEYVKCMGALIAGGVPGLQHEAPIRCLFLGGGGCSLPMLMSTMPALLNTDSQMRVVELSPSVAAVASEYFGTTDRVHIDLGDALDLNVGGDAYDIIAVDLFGVDNAQPPLQSVSSAWLQQLRSRLTADGVVVTNLHDGNSEAKARLATAEASYREVFSQVMRLKVEHQANTILCAWVSQEFQCDTGALQARSRAAGESSGWRFDPGSRLRAVEWLKGSGRESV